MGRIGGVWGVLGEDCDCLFVLLYDEDEGLVVLSRAQETDPTAIILPIAPKLTIIQVKINLRNRNNTNTIIQIVYDHKFRVHRSERISPWTHL